MILRDISYAVRQPAVHARAGQWRQPVALLTLDQAFDAHAAAGKVQALAANAEAAALLRRAAAELVTVLECMCREGAGPGSSGQQLLRRRAVGCGQKRVKCMRCVWHVFRVSVCVF